jgi:hypothetical protein
VQRSDEFKAKPKARTNVVTVFSSTDEAGNGALPGRGKPIGWIPNKSDTYIANCKRVGSACTSGLEIQKLDGKTYVHVQFGYIPDSFVTSVPECGDKKAEAAGKLPVKCFRQGQGWVELTDLEPVDPARFRDLLAAAQFQTDPGCEGCTEAKVKENIVDKTSKFAQEVAARLNRRTARAATPEKDSCGPKGKPKLFKLQHITFQLEQDEKGFCQMELIEGCGNEDATRAERLDEIAWATRSIDPDPAGRSGLRIRDGKTGRIRPMAMGDRRSYFCQKSMAKFYDQCGIWKDLDAEDRQNKFREISSAVVNDLNSKLSQIPSEGMDSSAHRWVSTPNENLTAGLLDCIAARETRGNYIYDPNVMNYTKCQFTRRGGESTAYGVAQFTLSTLRNFWNKFLRFVPEYAQRFRDADSFYYTLSEEPELQVHLMYWHILYELNRIAEVSAKKKMSDEKLTDQAVIAYRGNREFSYITFVRECKKCMDRTNGDPECTAIKPGTARPRPSTAKPKPGAGKAPPKATATAAPKPPPKSAPTVPEKKGGG